MDTTSIKDISATQLLLAATRTHTNIPYSIEIANILHDELIRFNAYTKASIEDFRNLAPILEAGYKAINKLLAENEIENILEFGSGMSSRGLELTGNPNIFYIESDLGRVIETKFDMVTEILRGDRRSNLFFQELNVLNRGDVRNAVPSMGNSSKAIVHEGLMVYFTPEEKRVMAQNIYDVFKGKGLVWITTDIITRDGMELMSGIDAKNVELKRQVDQMSLSDLKTNCYSSFMEPERLFSDIGFIVERHTYASIIPVEKIYSYQKLTPEVQAKVQDALNKLEVWAMRI